MATFTKCLQIFSLMLTGTNCWKNSWVAHGSKHIGAHCDVTSLANRLSLLLDNLSVVNPMSLTPPSPPFWSSSISLHRLSQNVRNVDDYIFRGCEGVSPLHRRHIGVACQITDNSTVCATVCLNVYKIKHQSSALLDFMEWNHVWPVNSPQKGPVSRKKITCHDVIIWTFLLIYTMSLFGIF